MYKFQIYSWTIADELLQQKRDLHSCYFAAQIMRNKIKVSFNELPMNSHESLRDSLIAHVGQITHETDTMIVTQLCLAVADLALLMSAWKEPVIDLLDTLSTQPQSVWPLLEILAMIPEEIDARYLRLGANRREEVHKQLVAAAPKVIDFLCLCLQHGGEPSHEKIINSTFHCYTSWVALQAIPLQQSAQNALTHQVFHMLSMENCPSKLHDTCSECLCALLSCIEANAGRDNLDPQLKLQIFTAVGMLEKPYHTAVGLEDIVKIMSYCRIFTTLCEAFFYEMFANEEVPHYSIKGLDLVLICVGHYDYEVAEITFNLWSRLSEELFHRNNDTLTNHFKPYIERLIGALYRLAQMEPDHEGLIDEKDSFNVSNNIIFDFIISLQI